MPATLKSRLPQIIAEMEPEIRGAMFAGAELIEARAEERVHDAPPIGSPRPRPPRPEGHVDRGAAPAAVKKLFI